MRRTLLGYSVMPYLKLMVVSVFGFTDPQVALKHFIANQQHYDLILTDFRMSELNGIELITKVNEIKPSIKALLMSAFK